MARDLCMPTSGNMTLCMLTVQIHLSIAGPNAYWVLWATGHNKVTTPGGCPAFDSSLHAHVLT